MAEDRDDASSPRGQKGGTVVMQAVIRPQSDSTVDQEEASVASTMAIPLVPESPDPRAHPVTATQQSALAMTECPTCHVATQAARYCSDCGAPLVQRRFCSECGVPLQSGAKFCEACGEKVP